MLSGITLLRTKKILFFANILWIGLIIYMATNIFFTWASQRAEKENPPETKAVPVRKTDHKFSKAKKMRAYQAIITRDIFDTSKNAAGSKIQRNVEIRPTGLRLRLLGTVVGDGNTSYAFILNEKTKREEFYAIDDFIEGARIVQIDPERVVLSSASGMEALIMSYEDRKTTSRFNRSKTRSVPARRAVIQGRTSRDRD
jgi:hypothetical protein